MKSLLFARTTFALGFLLGLVNTFAATTPAVLRASFAAPPADARPTVRWWWFGPAVVRPELEREMRLMQEGGFGGFEVQPTYPLALDAEYPGLKNFKFLSPEFFAALRSTAAAAKSIGLRMDLTLGSGWPYGGPMFTQPEAAQSIRDAGIVTIAPGQPTVSAPTATARRSGDPGSVIAALLGPIPNARTAEAYVPLPIEGRDAVLPQDRRGATQVRFFATAPAGLMRVKRPAYGAEGFIVDHYNPVAIEKFIRDVAIPEITACGPNVPTSLFCDSLEVSGEGWTPDFPSEFRRRRGYDLRPLLPALFDDTFPRAAEIRGDYGRTLAERFDDAFVNRFTELAHNHGTRFRIQAYGTPPTTLLTYARADLDEGENYHWRSLSGTRWASSASHLLGRPVTSAEAFTWLHSPVFMAAPIDLKAESNLQFLNGVNQLLFHGWPYTAPGVEYPGWRFYAAAVFDEKNPWWIVMPDITRYFARTCFLLRQGTPANDVALYLPEEDAFASMTPSQLEMTGAGASGLLNRRVDAFIPPILDAGFNFDAIDDGMLAARGEVAGPVLAFGRVHYRIVILPTVTRIGLVALRQLEKFVEGGGILIAVGHPPTLVPGFRATAADQQELQRIIARLFHAPDAKALVVPLERLAATLREQLDPDVALMTPNPNVGFIHRHLDGTELYFIANTANQPVAVDATFRVKATHAEWWDADTGRITVADAQTANDHARVTVQLSAYGAKFLLFSNRSPLPSDSIPSVRAADGEASAIDLSTDWDVTFKNSAPEPNPSPVHLAHLGSWTELPSTRYFSGVATYRKQFAIPTTLLHPGERLVLDFGPGIPGPVAGGSMGMKAEFQPPIGDAAIIQVNGRRAGALWCPPYKLDITGLLVGGSNKLQIDVANRAVNYLADTVHHPRPDYTALNANRELGGRRFEPQDMDKIQPTPSGLLGPIVLRIEP